eukprot:XP_020406598.1 uncharacterized protein LOC109945182 [Zea mays]
MNARLLPPPPRRAHALGSQCHCLSSQKPPDAQFSSPVAQFFPLVAQLSRHDLATNHRRSRAPPGAPPSPCRSPVSRRDIGSFVESERIAGEDPEQQQLGEG